MNSGFRHFLRTINPGEMILKGWRKLSHWKIWGYLEIRYKNLAVPRISFPEWDLAKFGFPKIVVPEIARSSIRLPRFSWKTDVIRHRLRQSSQVVVATMLAVFIFAGLATTKYYYGTSSAQAQLAPLEKSVVEELAQIEPATGTAVQLSPAAEPPKPQGRFPVEEASIDVQAVLVPNASTVISSSRDGRIDKINVDNGDLFRKGDILVEYGCEDVKAEIEIARSEQELTRKKSLTSAKLFKLDIISDYEKLEVETKDKQAEARVSLYENKMEDCYIRADYDGRVVKRLGNPGEFTRTDRVIMEVASLDYLQAEFLLPSKWLRWVNIGVTVQININETATAYDAKITRIHGEVDPVSQSIQMTARLEPYEDPLLPGMSGQITLSAASIQESGIKGFLETGPAH